jgi:23S rRNA pseudouridine1911/1915/1917 synthase
MNSESRAFIVQSEEATLRLDLYVFKQFNSLSRSKIQRSIRNGLVLVNGKQSKSSQILSAGDQVFIDKRAFAKKETAKASQQNIPVKIIYEDPHLIVVNKAYGMVTHPGAGNQEGTLVNALYNKLFKNDPIRPGVVHRLDKDTRGLIVFTKTKIAFDSLSLQFKTKAAKRTYHALCFGRFKDSEGTIQTYLARHNKDRKKFSSQESGKLAITHYKVHKNEAVSWVELNLETGRTHQIRVHLSELGHPILMDAIYSSPKKTNDIHDPVLKSKVRRLEMMTLYAKKLRFIHPESNEEIEFELPLPDDFLEFVDADN